MGRQTLVLALLACIAASGGMFWHARTAAYGHGTTIPATTQERTLAPSPIGRCMNMGNALEAPVEGEWGYRIRAEDFDTLKTAGFDTVRIPVKWSSRASLRPPYTLEPTALKRLDQVVRSASNSGLKVIINVHHYNELNDDAAMHLPRLHAIWRQLIFHYRDAPDTVMFEFLNEPHSDMTPARINTMNRQLLEEVRAVSPERWVVIGGGQWGTLDGLIATNPPYDPRAIVTFHYYSPFEFTHQGAPWAHKDIPLGQSWGSSEDRQVLANDFARAARWRNRVGMPMLLGEFGVYGKVPAADRSLWTNKVRRTAEEVGFGWCYWEFGASMGAYDLSTESFRPGMLEALTQ